MTDQDNDIKVEPEVPEGTEPEAPAEEGGTDDCPHCKTHTQNEEMAFAILLALVPALTLTFLSSVGLL